MVAAVTPYYLSSDEDELTTYYRAIHDAAGLPLLIYQVPMMAKTTLRVDAVLNLAREGTVVGIKDSSGDIGWLRNLTTRAAAEGLFLRAFVGGGALVDVSMLAGAAGAMCVIANLVPAHCRRLVAACVAGDWAVATSLQAELITLIRTLALPGRLNWTTTLSVYKFVLAERAVISSATCTRPIRPLQAGEREGIRTNALPLIERLEGEAGVVAHGSTGRANAHS
jgi:4-hydroxy-tetrahydrodipicolinate synthase